MGCMVLEGASEGEVWAIEGTILRLSGGNNLKPPHNPA